MDALICSRILPAILMGGVVVAGMNAQDVNLLKDFGSRHEGLFDRPNAGRALQLLGFFARDGDISPEKAEHLHVEFFLPGNQPAFIEARQLEPQGDYLMQSKPAGLKVDSSRMVRFSDWPIKDVLKPNHIEPDHLGIVVRLNSDNAYSTELAPAVLYGDAKAGAKLDYRMYVYFNRPLSRLRYELKAGNRKLFSCLADPERPDECVQGSQDIPIEVWTIVPLKIDMKNLNDEKAELQITAWYMNSSEFTSTSYHFTYRAPSQ